MLSSGMLECGATRSVPNWWDDYTLHVHITLVKVFPLHFAPAHYIGISSEQIRRFKISMHRIPNTCMIYFGAKFVMLSAYMTMMMMLRSGNVQSAVEYLAPFLCPLRSFEEYKLCNVIPLQAARITKFARTL